MNESRPRLSFDITEEQARRKIRLNLTHGLQKAVFQVILEDLLDLLEQHGHVICGLIIDSRARPRDILPSLTQASRSVSHDND